MRAKESSDDQLNLVYMRVSTRGNNSARGVCFFRTRTSLDAADINSILSAGRRMRVEPITTYVCIYVLRLQFAGGPFKSARPRRSRRAVSRAHLRLNCARSHTRTHARTHTYTHRYAYTRKHFYTHIYMENFALYVSPRRNNVARRRRRATFTLRGITDGEYLLL